VILNVNDTRNAHIRARNNTGTAAFSSLGFGSGSSRGRRGVVSSSWMVEGRRTSWAIAMLGIWHGNEREKLGVEEKSYRDVHGVD